MGRKKSPGLVNRNGWIYIDKRINGRRICRPTGEKVGKEGWQKAEMLLARISADIRNKDFFGVRPDRTFKEAVAKYMDEVQVERPGHDLQYLKILMPYIGHLSLSLVNNQTIKPFIIDRQKGVLNNRKVKNRSINESLRLINRILKLAATEWFDGELTWLASPSHVKKLHQRDSRKPRAVTLQEFERLVAQQPDHLKDPIIFKANTGCREQEVCGLEWAWEIWSEELGETVFVIPGEVVKNREDRIVILNADSRAAVNRQRGKNPKYVFTYKGKRMRVLNNSGWVNARKRAGLAGTENTPSVRIHDLKHTLGRRLADAGVPFEQKKALLGHKLPDITWHYSPPSLKALKKSVDMECNSRKFHAKVISIRKTG